MDFKDVITIYESLKVIRKGNKEDYELRASADEKIWAVKSFSDSPSKPTYCLYVGPDAKEMACDLADYELEDDDEDFSEEEEDDEDEDEDDDTESDDKDDEEDEEDDE